MIYNVLVGNQLIVRGDLIDAAVSVAFALSLLIPVSCGVSVRHFTQYLHAYEATFLVVPLAATLPLTQLEPSSYVIIELTQNDVSSILVQLLLIYIIVYSREKWCSR